MGVFFCPSHSGRNILSCINFSSDATSGESSHEDVDISSISERYSPPISLDDILVGLDPTQKKAATSLEGPVRIIAVAGAGKTRTITRRIAYGCRSGAWDEERTVAVTFSVKAAKEMRERLALLGVHNVRVQTFHALALSQLRYLWEKLIGKDFPELITPSISTQIIKKTLSRIGNISALDVDIQNIITEISWTKVSLIPSSEYVRVCSTYKRIPPAGLSAEQMALVIDSYERTKSELWTIDFSDILLILCHLLRISPEAGEYMRQQIGWLTIDEYQDVSPLQHQLVKLWLCPEGEFLDSAKNKNSGNRNICVVGDPAQMIYSFAGATNWYLLHFADEFPDISADIPLATDYRSKAEIIDCANHILQSSHIAQTYILLESCDDVSSGEEACESKYAQGENKKEKNSLTKKHYLTDEEEARAIARLIVSLIGKGQNPQEIAVLSRIRAQLTLVAKVFDEYDIPYASHRISNNGETKIIICPAVKKAIESGELSSLNTPLVTLSTIHASKGLEWDTVFIIGASEGLLPYYTNMNNIEEERRILYVGVTRGRKNVYISYAQRKDNHSQQTRKPTRFLT